MTVNDEIEAIVCKQDGVALVLSAMRAHADLPSVVHGGCGVLRNLSSNADNEVFIAQEGGISLLLGAVRTFPQHAGVVEEAMGALRNIAWNTDMWASGRSAMRHVPWSRK